MRDLLVAKSPHVVRLYKVAEPVGRKKDLMGMYMEYCPGGNLGSLVAPLGTGGGLEAVLECDLWGMFACLVTGVVAMEKGNEDAEGVGRLMGKEGLGLVHYE